LAPGIGALADMDHAGIKIDTGPIEAAQFAKPHASEYRGQLAKYGL
jgi:hypothetical protein